jgi:hypothetical protein
VSDSVNCHRCGARGDAACVCGMPPSIARQMPPPHLRGTVPAAKVYDPRGDELRAEIGRLRVENSDLRCQLVDAATEARRLRGLLREAWPYVADHFDAGAKDLHDRIYAALPAVRTRLPTCSCSGPGKSDDPCPEHEA